MRRINVLLLALAVALTVLSAAYGADIVPVSTLVVPIVAGGLLLNPARMRILIVLCFAGAIAVVAANGMEQVRALNLVVVAAVALIGAALATDRQRLGLSMGRGETMLIELRDTLARQGKPPHLPAGWHADVARRPAGGGSFSGDFLVARRSADGRRLELALVDVSGKGIDAGTRSLLLSGAFGALLGSVPPDEFLPAANEYVLRQSWLEGFATCVHVSVDLATGRYRLGNAGHPPAAHFNGGSGRWSLLDDTSGTALGLYEDAPFGTRQGELRAHDALLLFTDGLVEVPGRDLEVGIDRLLGATERMVARGFEGSAELLIDSGASGVNDDRALVLLWRTP